MRFAFVTCLALAAGVTILPRSAEAHHGWAEFDETAEVTVAATVSVFHFVNPHCVVEFDRKDNAGHVQRWQGEFGSPHELARKGWSAASLQPGDHITITGHPSKANIPALHVIKIRTADGKEVGSDGQD
jgi:hypothetical protein